MQPCQNSLYNLNGQVQGPKEEYTFLYQDVQKIRERTCALEDCVKELEGPHSHWVIKEAMKKSDTDARKMEDLENRLRRNNIRLVSLPEHFEGANLTEHGYGRRLGKKHLSMFFSVERAHRVPSSHLLAGAPLSPPWPFLMQLLNQ